MEAPKKEFFIKQKLKKEDPVELPMDDLFFEQMHNKIMQAVEKTEIKTPTKWAKSKIFLEQKALSYQPLFKKAVKVAVVGLVTSISVGLLGVSQTFFASLEGSNGSSNQSKILQEAGRNPSQWLDMVVSYQNESDFYAEVLSRRSDLATMVEIDQVLAQSL